MEKRLYIENVREGIKILMNNPSLVISVENSNDYNGYADIMLDDGRLVEQFFGKDGFLCDGEYTFKVEPVTVDDRKCHIDINHACNFLYIAKHYLDNITSYADIYSEILKGNDSLIEMCKYVYYDYFESVINTDSTLSEEVRDSLTDILEA